MTPQEEIIASLLSNIIALLLLLVSLKKKNTARILFAFIFLWAAFTNWRTVSIHPEAYLDYAKYAIPLYKKIILGEFSNHITGYVLCIAAGQLMIGLGLLSRRYIVKAACFAGIIFLLAIAPLGRGAAFPFSITASIALFILYRHMFTKDIVGNRWLV